MNFRTQQKSSGVEIQVEVTNLIIAGWTGRDRNLVEKHIAELAVRGVKPPQSTPVFDRAAASLLTTDGEIEVIGDDSSGEVEFVLVALTDGLYVGVGSDHTDRKVETYDITVSKQMCAKPLGRDLWRLSDVATHWDNLILRAYCTRSGERALYQEGPVSAMLTPFDLIRRYTDGTDTLPAGTVMFCGTLPVIGRIAGGERFEIALFDPVTGKRIDHGYGIRALPPIE